MIKGSYFEKETVSPIEQSIITDYLTNRKNGIMKGYSNDISVTSNELTLTVGTGSCIICGRPIHIIGEEQIIIPPNSSGYLVVKVDLSQINQSIGEVGTKEYSVINNQISVEFVTSLVQEDLNNGGTIYMLNLGTVASTGTTATYTKNVSSVIKPFDLRDDYKIITGTTVTTTHPAGYIQIFTVTQWNSLFGNISMHDSFLQAMNGDWNALNVHLGNAFISPNGFFVGTWYAGTSTVRINWMVLLRTSQLPVGWKFDANLYSTGSFIGSDRRAWGG